jgi:16S rRNA (uracil1498-N3)-methyltransferase
MGLQRHLKVAGIFARLTLRDGKPKYLADAPRFIGYIRATASPLPGAHPAACGWWTRSKARRRPPVSPSGGFESKMGLQPPMLRSCYTAPDMPLHPGLCDSRSRLPAGAARHVQVLRLQPGMPSRCLMAKAANLTATSSTWAAAMCGSAGAHDSIEREAPVAVHLVVGMPANERMDWLVEKATELGVASIQPVVAQRSVLRLKGERADKKRAHWQGIAMAACEQCGRNRVPQVHEAQPLQAWLEAATQRGGPTGIGLLLSLAAGALPLPQQRGDATTLTLLSGPEGGLAPAEEQAALACGFLPVSLGSRVLRSETAPLAVLAALTLGS